MSEMNDANPTVVFDKPVGLAMSGGGYRAAAFHLGALSFLRRMSVAGHLPDVGMISTVSGGTFTGMKYALSLALGQSFDDYFCELYHFLENSDPIKQAFDQLASRRRESPTKAGRRNSLIVAISDVYARDLLADAKGRPYRLKLLLDDLGKNRLQAFVFNATEFDRGLAFRFQGSAKRKVRIGNYFMEVSREGAAVIRLADILAASSCFPAGFEPISFPEDFTWPNQCVPPCVAAEFESLPLMDGGIHDNQGIEGLFYADQPAMSDDVKDPEIGMFIISDVDRQARDIMSMPDDIQLNWIGTLTPQKLRVAMTTAIIICLSTIALTVADSVMSENTSVVAWLTRFFSVAVSAGVAALLLKPLLSIKAWLRTNIGSLPTDVTWQDLKKIPLRQLASMVQLRGISLVNMAMYVFMRRIRQLGFGLIYRSDQFKHRRVSNLIYSLERGWKLGKLAPPPSPAMKNVIAAATGMGLALSFKEKHHLPSLVAAGQCSMCYNLMKFLQREFGPTPATHADSRVRALWDQLTQDWEQLNKSPFAFVSQMTSRNDLAAPPSAP